MEVIQENLAKAHKNNQKFESLKRGKKTTVLKFEHR